MDMEPTVVDESTNLDIISTNRCGRPPGPKNNFANMNLRDAPSSPNMIVEDASQTPCNVAQ